jgi:hypothetical protein
MTTPAGSEERGEGLRTRLLELLGPSHPHDEGRDCGTCAAYNLLAATPAPDSGAEERLRAALEHEHGPECGECITLARSTVMAFAVEAGLEHVDRFDCWCGPVKDYEDPATGNQVWVHREVSS